MPDITLSNLGPDELKAFMAMQQVDGEIIHCHVPTPTVEAAAQALGTHPENIIKSILFIVSGQPVIAITCGTAYVDKRAIGDHYHIGRKQVKTADAETVLAVTGYAAGAVPPFGHRQPLATFLDPQVIKQEWVYGGGGAENALLRVRSSDILRVTNGQILDMRCQ
jgi:prolyl-tRNA editing enzyme YbaK/EbsC (Cys-tRNA(Pro) deacylase)